MQTTTTATLIAAAARSGPRTALRAMYRRNMTPMWMGTRPPLSEVVPAGEGWIGPRSPRSCIPRNKLCASVDFFPFCCRLGYLDIAMYFVDFSEQLYKYTIYSAFLECWRWFWGSCTVVHSGSCVNLRYFQLSWPLFSSVCPPVCINSFHAIPASQGSTVTFHYSARTPY